ncbi:uncharacterized protein PAC_02575 [Phialocephala subalpina]|uniref:Uncharacterized protein n=1 Tax=Phialocephala subalpina TaxID=576137 RepID=A0A1L7WIY6_9HELO|nr:uncharacterized protein PAC_02575 [Phialocephala subalpina]
MTSSSPLELPSLQRLQSAEQNELLDVIDSLRSQGLGDFISLPQLIVCGDQSSGKSSVLEAISGIPFPRQETLCTRFATEVILRKTPKDKITASIAPEKGRTISELALLKDFQHELKTQEDFSTLFDKAGETMGFSTSGKSFCKDILRVEICGPSQPQLTLVDLPGLIHTATKTQTPGDVLLVHDLVEQYLRSPRSIILAVVSAKNDIGNQIILERARKFDSRGRRTLGIITKPDTLMRGSKNEQAFISLARNEDVFFDLGWHVVKNLDSADHENQSESRDAQETRYFETSNFSRLPSHNVGIASLRSRLSKVLFDQIRTELPELVEEIRSKVLSTKEVLGKLGPSREKVEQQREFLISLSQTFQTICHDAVRGNYEHEFFRGTQPERRLCAEIMNKHFQFARIMRDGGATWKIVDGNSTEVSSQRRLAEHSTRTRDQAIEEACALLKRSRGRELPGLPNPSLVGELFRQYTKPWKKLARGHVEDVWETTIKFLELLLRHLTDDDSCEKIQRHWLLPKMEEKLSLAYEKLAELLAVHEDQPMTTNTQFLSNSKINRPQKSDNELLKMIKDGDLEDADDAEIAKLLSAWGKNDQTDMDMLAAEEAFDNMNAFYEVAITLFMDNVPTLAIQLPIIRGLPDILCPTAIFSMDSETIKNIAGESEEKVLERTTIARKLKVLEDGGRICKQYARRVQPFLSSVTHDREEFDTSSIRLPTDPRRPINIPTPPSKRTAASASLSCGFDTSSYITPGAPVQHQYVAHADTTTSTSASKTPPGSRAASDSGSTSVPMTTNKPEISTLKGGRLFGTNAQSASMPSSIVPSIISTVDSVVTKTPSAPGNTITPASSNTGGLSTSLKTNNNTHSTFSNTGGLFGQPSKTSNSSSNEKPSNSHFALGSGASTASTSGTANEFGGTAASGSSETRTKPPSLFGSVSFKPAAAASAGAFGKPPETKPTQTTSLFGPGLTLAATPPGAFGSGFGQRSGSVTPNLTSNAPRMGQDHHLKENLIVVLTEFFPHIEKERNTAENMLSQFMHICFMPQCEKKSPEELRLAYWELGRAFAKG